jgi:hypothetical protein
VYVHMVSGPDGTADRRESGSRRGGYMKHSTAVMSLGIALAMTTAMVPPALAQDQQQTQNQNQQQQDKHPKAKGAAAGAAIGAVTSGTWPRARSSEPVIPVARSGEITGRSATYKNGRAL